MKTFKTELVEGGYAKIDAKVQSIEALAYEGVFSDKDTVSRFQQIISEAKKLRQTLREVLHLVPAFGSKHAGGDAA
jgi:hypothetical protein